MELKKAEKFNFNLTRQEIRDFKQASFDEHDYEEVNCGTPSTLRTSLNAAIVEMMNAIIAHDEYFSLYVEFERSAVEEVLNELKEMVSLNPSLAPCIYFAYTDRGRRNRHWQYPFDLNSWFFKFLNEEENKKIPMEIWFHYGLFEK
jgi:hypothetical protein